MDALNTILTVGGIAAAITAIITLAIKVYDAYKKVAKFFNGIRDNVNMLVEHDKEQHLSILRLIIVEDNMPVSERLIAGREYVDKGGNGDVKHLYEELEEKCEQINRSDSQ